MAATQARSGRMVLTGKAAGMCMGTPYFCAQREVSSAMYLSCCGGGIWWPVDLRTPPRVMGRRRARAPVRPSMPESCVEARELEGLEKAEEKAEGAGAQARRGGGAAPGGGE